MHRRGTSVATTGQKERESAANAGFGLRFSMRSVLTGYLELAQPLTRDVTQEGNHDARAVRRRAGGVLAARRNPER